MKFFHATLRITKFCCRAVQDDKFEPRRCRFILPAQTLVSRQVPCLGVTEYGEKGQRNFHAVTWSSISRDAGQATEQGNHQCQSKVRFPRCRARKKRAVHRQKAKIHIQIRRVGRTFCVVDKTQILCLAGFYTGRSNGPPRDQVRASSFFFFSAAVTKTGG